MTERKQAIVGIGELLWDMLPGGKQLGGAPANFAYITNLLGDRGIPASRVGNDQLGEEARDRMAQLGLSRTFVQNDSEHPTGSVEVEIDRAGQPTFKILQSVAWDFLEWSGEWRRLAASADAVCFGSLAQRSPKSRMTIQNFLSATQAQTVRIFDVNLRQDFYTREILQESMQLATVLKLNHDELPRIARLFGLENCSELEAGRRLIGAHGLKLVCVTRGSHGSLLISQKGSHEHGGFRVKIADTVGAGDAFTAALVHGYMRGHSLAEMNERANRVGAWVASQSGGMPPCPRKGLEKALAQIA
jgi:fructokinase